MLIQEVAAVVPSPGSISHGLPHSPVDGIPGPSGPVVLPLEADLKIAKPVEGVSIMIESGTGGSPPLHASAAVSPGPVAVDVLSEFEQPVMA